MKNFLNPFFFIISAVSLCLGCSQSTTTGSNGLLGGTNGTVPTLTGNNVVRVEVGLGGTGLCNGDSYTNEPCAAVTICSPSNPSSCQTINNILVDTGSYGLRIFSSAINISLTQISNYAECAQFGTGSTWGPIEKANVTLGGDTTTTSGGIPIQVINSKYASVPSSCGTPDDTPANAGYNGILGVGLFAQDCGSTCVTTQANETYYTCTGTTCTQTTMTLANQVINPVAAMGTDNTGVMMLMPSISTEGDSYNFGYLVLGVSTETNNKPSGTQTYTADNNINDANYGNFDVTFNGSTVGGFIDSGSNGLFFPGAGNSTPTCSDNPSWFCPATVYSSSATNTGYNGVSGSSQFIIANADTLFNTNNYLIDVGGSYSGGFDWGLPFFYGKYVYIGLEGRTVSGVGTGPYWAY